MGKQRAPDLSYSQGHPGKQTEVEGQRQEVWQGLQQDVTREIRRCFPEGHRQGFTDWWHDILVQDCTSAVSKPGSRLKLKPQSLLSFKDIRLADYSFDQAVEYIRVLIDLADYVELKLSGHNTADSVPVAVLARRGILQLMLLATLAHSAAQPRPASQKVTTCKCWYCICSMLLSQAPQRLQGHP